MFIMLQVADDQECGTERRSPFLLVAQVAELIPRKPQECLALISASVSELHYIRLDDPIACCKNPVLVWDYDNVKQFDAFRSGD